MSNVGLFNKNHANYQHVPKATMTKAPAGTQRKFSLQSRKPYLALSAIVYSKACTDTITFQPNPSLIELSDLLTSRPRARARAGEIEIRALSPALSRVLYYVSVGGGRFRTLRRARKPFSRAARRRGARERALFSLPSRRERACAGCSLFLCARERRKFCESGPPTPLLLQPRFT